MRSLQPWGYKIIWVPRLSKANLLKMETLTRRMHLIWMKTKILKRVKEGVCLQTWILKNQLWHWNAGLMSSAVCGACLFSLVGHYKNTLWGRCFITSTIGHYKNTLWGRCFITSTGLALLLFLLFWLKLNLNNRSVDIDLGRWMPVVAVIYFDTLVFVRTDLSPREYVNKCFLVGLCPLIVRRPNLKVATKWVLHQQVKIQG